MRKTIKKSASKAAADTELSSTIENDLPQQSTDAPSPVPAVAQAPISPFAIAEMNDNKVESVDSDGWAVEIDWSFLDPSRAAPAPVFPIEKLPEPLAELVAKLALARRLVVDFVAFAILAALSGAIGNRARVQLFDGTLEPLAIYVALVGAPSTGKSQAIGMVETRLRALDGDLTASVSGAAMAASHAALDRLNVKIRAKVAERLAVEFEAPEDYREGPRGGRLLLTETTGPGLIEELSADRSGRMLVTHELSGAIGYLSSSQPARSRGLFLQGFDGNPVVVSTKSEGRKLIPELLLSVLGAVQPGRLSYLMRHGDDGFAARFFWVHPDVVPSAALGDNPGPIDDLAGVLSALQGIQPAANEHGYSAAVPLAADARTPLEMAAKKWTTDQMFSSELFSSALGRGRQYALRLAGILQIATHVMEGKSGLPDVVSADAMTSAIAIVDTYILPMAERVFAASDTKPSDAAALARFLARSGKPMVNARADIMRGRGSPVTQALAVREAIEELEQRGVLRPAPQRPGRGRPSSDWIVHPALLAMARK
ncbi:DUF3987 domain-containing protein [Pelagibacterium mangrovi]|uniref:DUF3987 domain-containing protein n=1 Tax=Pelagibacterium mangrovi TaxID=3119828 RepID=UPI002FCA26CF